MANVDFASFVQTEFVPVPGKEGQGFPVRGLSADDLSKMFRLHGAALNALYLERIVASEGDPEAMSVNALGRALLETAPEAAAAAIALAADAEEQYGYVRKLPLPVQVDALAKIAALTFHSEEDLGNFVRTVLLGGQTVQKVLASLTKAGPSTPGSEAFAKP